MRRNLVTGREVIMKGPVDSVNILDFSLCKMEVFGKLSVGE